MKYLDQVRTRLMHATPGPWMRTLSKPWRGKVRWSHVLDGTTPIAKLFSEFAHHNHAADADFVAHARTDIPELLERVGLATEILKIAQADLRAWHYERKCECNPCGVCDAGMRVSATLIVLDRPGPMDEAAITSVMEVEESQCCCWAFDHPPCPVHPKVAAPEDSDA